MIDLAILGLLKEQELHGYELRKRVAELLGSYRGGLSFGSLYPALSRLEKAGLVKAVEAIPADRSKAVPSPGSLAGELAAFRARHSLSAAGGRGRKVYGITQRGDAHLHDLLCDPDTSDDRSFALRVAFCRFLEPAERLSLFHARRAEVAGRLAERGGAGDGRREGRLDRYLRSLREHDSAAITADLAWLDRLIEDERAEHVTSTEEAT